MRPVVIGLAAALLGAGAALAQTAPTLPARPQLQFAGVEGDASEGLDDHYFIDTASRTRSGDTVTFWLLLISYYDTPNWYRVRAECTGSRLIFEWQVYDDPADGDPMQSGAAVDLSLPTNRVLHREACSTGPIRLGPTYASVGAADASTRRPPPPEAFNAPTYDLGPVVRMRETSRTAGAAVYEGVWTRRGASNVYDAVWIYQPTGQRFTDVLEVEGVTAGVLVIHRRGNDGRYRIPVTVNGDMGQGTASWVADPNFYWEVVQ